MKYCFLFLGLLIFATSCEERMILEAQNVDPEYATLEIQVLYQQQQLLSLDQVTVEIYTSKSDALLEFSPISSLNPDFEGKVTKGFLDVKFGRIYIRVDHPQFGTYIGTETLIPDVKSYHLIEFATGFYYDLDDRKIQAPKTVSLERPMVGQISKYEKFISDGPAYYFGSAEKQWDRFLDVEVKEYLGDGKYKVTETVTIPPSCSIDSEVQYEVENIWKFKDGRLTLLQSDHEAVTSVLFAGAGTLGFTLDYLEEASEQPLPLMRDNAPGYYAYMNLEVPNGIFKQASLRIISNPETGALTYFQFYNAESGFLKTFEYTQQNAMVGYRLIAS